MATYPGPFLGVRQPAWQHPSASPSPLPSGAGAGSMQGLPYQQSGSATTGVGRWAQRTGPQVRNPFPGARDALTSGGERSYPGGSLTARGPQGQMGQWASRTGPQMRGPSMPGSGLINRGGFLSRHPNVARGVGTVGRGFGGAVVGSGGAAVADIVGDNPFGRAISAGSAWGGPAFMAGGPASATVGLGVGAGSLGGEAITDAAGREGGYDPFGTGAQILDSDATLANVPGNLSRGLGLHENADLLSVQTGEEGEAPQLSGPLAEFAQAGVAPADIVEWLNVSRDEEDYPFRESIATGLARSGVPGADLDDDGMVTIAPEIGDFINELGNADSGDPAVRFLRHASENHLEEDEIGLGMNALIEAQGMGMEPQAAAQAAQGEVEAAREQRQMEQDMWADNLARSEQAMRYLAPVTGRMRADADFLYDQVSQRAEGMPEDQANYLRQMAEFERAQQHQLASAYEQQMQMAPYQAQVQQGMDLQGRVEQAMLNPLIQQAAQQGLGQMGVGGQDGGIGQAALGGPQGTQGANLTAPQGTTPQMSPMGDERVMLGAG